MPFDARAAKLLQPGRHLLILPEHPGLRIQRSTTRWSWIYRSLVDDGVRQVKIGEWPAKSYPDAAQEWARLSGERAGGRDPVLEKRSARRAAQAEKAQKKASAYTVAMLVQDYLGGHVDVHRKPKGRAEVRRVLEKHTAKIAAMPAALVLRSEAFDLLQGLKDTPVIAAQVRQELGAAWDYGLDAGKLPENTANWWRQIMRGKLRSKGKKLQGENVGTGKRVLNEQELSKLLVWMPNFSKLVADAVTMYLWTGCRGAEILPMERSEIVEEEGGVLWWTIPKERTKNARHENAMDLRVPLIGRARELVVRRAALTDRYLFKSTGRLGYTEQKTIQSTVYSHQPYSKSRTEGMPVLTVTHWSPHDLRRSVRTLLAKMGCPNDVAEAVLGHMQAGIVGVYNRHAYDEERLLWLTRLDARLEQLAAQHAAS